MDAARLLLEYSFIHSLLIDAYGQEIHFLSGVYEGQIVQNVVIRRLPE